jgi:hypothetical protein
MHLGTGMITKMLASPLRTGDMSGTVELHPEMRANDLLVADRAFCSFAHLCLLIERGVEAVLRVHQTFIVDFTPGRPYVFPHKGTGSKRKGLPRSRWIQQLGVSDQIVAWQKNTRGKPSWMSAEQFALLPMEITVRELRYAVTQKGFRSQEITLVTTLLDVRLYTLPALADLFRQRWEIETCFGHLKTTMKMDVLKCKTVDGVLRELHAFALVYNLVRQVMVEAANRQRVLVKRISFVDALRWLKEAALHEPLTTLVVNPDRPERYEPRVRKRRPKKYKLMTEPRRILKQPLAEQ